MDEDVIYDTLNRLIRAEEMDIYEIMSWDLEAAQQKRHAKAGGKDNFWTGEEASIFEFIKDLRSKSKTFDPNNSR